MFNIKTYIDPKGIWNYYKEHPQELFEKMVLVAETTYDDADTKCYLFLTEDSGKPFLTLESENEIIDSTHLEKDNYKVLTQHFLEKLDKTIPLTLQKAKGSLPNENMYTGEITKVLDSFLVKATGKSKIYLLKSNSNSYYIRMPGKTIGVLETDINDVIFTVTIENSSLERFQPDTKIFLKSLSGYTLRCLHKNH